MIKLSPLFVDPLTFISRYVSELQLNKELSDMEMKVQRVEVKWKKLYLEIMKKRGKWSKQDDEMIAERAWRNVIAIDKLSDGKWTIAGVVDEFYADPSTKAPLKHAAREIDNAILAVKKRNIGAALRKLKPETLSVVFSDDKVYEEIMSKLPELLVWSCHTRQRRTALNKGPSFFGQDTPLTRHNVPFITKVLGRRVCNNIAQLALIHTEEEEKEKRFFEFDAEEVDERIGFVAQSWMTP